MKLNRKIFVLCMCFVIPIGLLIYWNVKNTENNNNDLINIFNKNYVIFEKTQKYISSIEGDFVVNYYNGKLEINQGEKKIEIDRIPIKNEMIYILKKLKFNGIYKYNGDIEFVKDIKQYKLEIYYNSGTVEPNFELGNSVKLKSNWYYFEFPKI